MKLVMRKVTCVVLIACVAVAALIGYNSWVNSNKVTTLSPYQGKVISIMGDSISTYEGYIPDDDGINLAHRSKYPQKNLLQNVNKTWWMQLINDLDAELGVNDSWAGSTVSNTILGNDRDWGENAAMASLTRIENLASNGTPDVILFFGGTNDIGLNVMLGVFNSDNVPEEVDLVSTTWNTFVDAYMTAIMRMQYYYPEAEIIAMLPTYTDTYYDDDRLNFFNEEIIKICDYFNVRWVDLRESGVTTDMLPDGIHPNKKGMACIASAVQETMLTEVIVTADIEE